MAPEIKFDQLQVMSNNLKTTICRYGVAKEVSLPAHYSSLLEAAMSPKYYVSIQQNGNPKYICVGKIITSGLCFVLR